jgi:hypothetical protein
MKKANAKQKKIKSALIVCRGGGHYWTTQQQFWQWVREFKVVKVGDGPLTGKFVQQDEESLVVLKNTVLSLNRPIHLSEALAARRLAHRK